VFDLNVLEAVEVSEGDFLKAGGATPFFQSSTIDNTAGKITKLSAARFSGGVSGTGRLFSVTFMAKTTGDAQVTLTNLHAGSSDLTTIPLSIPEITITVEDKPTPDVDSAKLSFSIDETPIRVGDTFTLNLNVENVTDLAGWQCNIVFDPNVLEAVEVSEGLNVLEAVEVVGGDFLKAGGATPFFQSSTIDNTAGKITKLSAARFSGGVSSKCSAFQWWR
jgi:adhesin HecA-like repeat protein